LLAGLVLAAAGLFRLVLRAGAQAAAVAAIKESGGKVYYDWEMARTSRPDRVGLVHVSNDLTPQPGGRPPWPEALVTLFGPDVFGAVVGVEIPPVPVQASPNPNAIVTPDPAEERARVQEQDDALMARVGRLGGLKWLSVAGVPMTDKGMEHLQRLPQLETLKLAFLTGTTGQGFRSVGALKNLRTLEVDALPLSDDDFSVLHNLVALRVLTLQNVNLTDQGMEHLGGLLNLSKLTLNAVKVRNAGLGHLSRLSHLTSLSLKNTSLDDLEKLRGLTAVRDLDLAGNPLRDDALAGIVDLPDLRRLDISQTFVTNECLETLAKVPRLSRVRARDTRIRHVAVEEFRKSHTQVEFEMKPLRPPPAPKPES
jgi:hypothetical protein